MQPFPPPALFSTCGHSFYKKSWSSTATLCQTLCTFFGICFLSLHSLPHLTWPHRTFFWLLKQSFFLPLVGHTSWALPGILFPFFFVQLNPTHPPRSFPRPLAAPPSLVRCPLHVYLTACCVPCMLHTALSGAGHLLLTQEALNTVSKEQMSLFQSWYPYRLAQCLAHRCSINISCLNEQMQWT